jgi:hypothetical protein
LEELESLKREMVVQLERIRVDEQSSKESLNKLLDQYEATRQEVLKYEQDHRHDVDRAKYGLLQSIPFLRAVSCGWAN